MDKEDKIIGGAFVREYTISDGKITVVIIDYGARIKSIFCTDKNGERQDVVLGFDSDEGYLSDETYEGAFVGRNTNRIIGGAFSINGKQIKLSKNDGNNHHHGVFASRFFEVSEVKANSVMMTLVSPPEEEGYPGTMTASVRYSVSGGGLKIEFTAVCDEDTIANFTSHSYFNLAGQNGESALEHYLTLTADRYNPITEESVPTGEILSVENTPFDFRKGKKIKEDIDSSHPELTCRNTYDHNLILPEGEGMRYFGTLYSEESGIKMDCFTTEPSVQLFVRRTDGELTEKGKKNLCRSAVCLETQHYPATPSFPHFPTTVLKKGDTYRQTTEFVFSVRNEEI